MSGKAVFLCMFLALVCPGWILHFTECADITDGRKGLVYRVEAYTGSWIADTALATIHCTLIGTMASSKPISLLQYTYITDSVASREFIAPEDLGDVYLVKLDMEALVGFIPFINDWFCAKVVIITPENKRLVFPVYRWFHRNESITFRTSIGVLKFNETIPRALGNREQQLHDRNSTFVWATFAEGLPQNVEAESAIDLPAEVRFSFKKNMQIGYTVATAMKSINLTMPEGNTSWSSMEEVYEFYHGPVTPTYNYVKAHWMEDEFFGYQFLNGINPMLITRCSKLPAKFPVTEDMVQDSLKGGLSLAEEMERGHIFLVDYEQLDGIPANVVEGQQQYLAAPLVLLYLTPDNKMMPIAIQLKQQPGDNNPIFLPTDSEYDWLVAKTFVRLAEFSVHELNYHFLRTHLVAEGFTMSTLRKLPMVHPIYKLLQPHFRYTLQINTVARDQLIGPEGLITVYAGVGGPGMVEYLQRAVAAFDYRYFCFPDNIADRGMESLPDFYYYRNDGQKLWDKLYSYVDGTVRFYYPNDEYVQKDTELQKWAKEIFVHVFLSMEQTGIPDSFSTVKDLVKYLTMIIFTSSTQHAAVNNGQFDYFGLLFNGPFSMERPPPEQKGLYNLELYLQTLPDKNITAISIVNTYLLSQEFADFVSFGHSSLEYFTEDIPVILKKEFQEALSIIEEEINERNKNLPLPYEYLLPSQIENSVAI